VLFPAEVPCGPICPNEVVTFAIASPLHWSPVATVIPPAVAPKARDNRPKMDPSFYEFKVCFITVHRQHALRLISQMPVKKTT
jgi:hypothetical protein